jgi:hypothetical protein
MNSEVFSQWVVYLNKSDKQSNFLANGSVVVAGTIKCKFKIMKGPKGIFAAFPSEMVEKDGQKTFYPQMNLLDDTTKELFQTEALAAYEAAQSQAPAKTTTPKRNTANIPF